tara:strand:- start:2166 stop:2954 length:789 start_codon:yes stop_codon:yes gene_type:complete
MIINPKQNNGYLIVASKRKSFYLFAINLIESILDYHPKAKITLFTEERFVDHRVKVCDQVIYCDDHYRAKLWGMTRSPYDLTFYMDADMECQHEDIANVFDCIGDEDIVFTGIDSTNDKVFVYRYFTEQAEREKNEVNTFKYNGGVCLYDNSKLLVKNFMQDWQLKYYLQYQTCDWWPLKENGEKDFDQYPRKLHVWDQFTLWWLTTHDPKYKELNVGLFDDHLRWNYYVNYEQNNIISTKPPVLSHYSSSAPKNDLIVAMG